MNGNNNYDDPAMDDGEMMDDAFDDAVAGDEYGEGPYDDEYAEEGYAEGEYEEGAYDEEGGPYEGEEWDESYDGQDGAVAGGDDEEARQKKRARFNMMVIGGGVALGAVFMLFQLMSGGPAPAPAPALPQTAASSATDGQAQEAARRRLASASLHDSSPETQRNVIHGRGRDDIGATISETAQAGGLLNDPDEVRRVDEYRSRLNEEFENMYEEGISFGGRSIARPQDAAEDVSEHEAALTPLPGEEADMLPSPRGLEEQAGGIGLPRAEDLRLAGTPDDAGVLEPVQDNGAGLSAPPSPFGAVPPMPENAPLQDVPYGHEPVSHAQVRQDQAVPQADLDAAPAVMPPMLEDVAGDQSAAQVAAEREKITALESELTALNSAISTERSGFESRIRDLEKTIKQLEIALESQAGAAAQKTAVQSAKPDESVRAATAAQSAAPRSQAARTAAPARQAAPVRWVLKAAGPGTAMVSRQGDSEIRNIAIGDTLPGIGRVNQIYQGTNGWVVEGSQGRISQ